MRSRKTEDRMVRRLGFDPTWIKRPDDGCGHGLAEMKLELSEAAHVIYALVYRGKRARNKERLDLDFYSEYMEVFMDDESFFKRTSELYAKGIYWIGAVHRKDSI